MPRHSDLSDTAGYQSSGEVAEQPTIYRPLSQGYIRLLHLRPANRLEAPLVGTLDYVYMDDEPGYEALSYAWGGVYCDNGRDNDDHHFGTDHMQPGELSVDGLSIPITWNLRDALRRLRRDTQTRKLWIDAICINQENDEEKAIQVALMAEIYKNASEVVVWLGEDSRLRNQQDGAAFFEGCWKYAKISKSTWSQTWRKAVHRAGLEGFLQRDMRRLELLTLFGNRRYFSRLWCVQEMALANRVVLACGSMTAPLTLIELIEDNTPDYADDSFNMAWLGLGFVGIRPMLDIRKTSTNAPAIFERCQNLDCSDHRDRIYALSSLLRGDARCPVINIDYSVPWPVVFTNFARDCITNDHALSWQTLLSAAGQWHYDIHSRSTDLPSWVPDWRNGSDRFHNDLKDHETDAEAEEFGITAVRESILVIKLGYCGTIASLSQELDDLEKKRYHEDDRIYGVPSRLFQNPDRTSRRSLVLRKLSGEEGHFRLVGLLYDTFEPTILHEITIV